MEAALRMNQPLFKAPAYENKIIQGPWNELSSEEVYWVDGGAWGARQWAACGLIVAGTACAIVGIWCPTLWGGSAKAWGTAGAILCGGGGILAIT